MDNLSQVMELKQQLSQQIQQLNNILIQNPTNMMSNMPPVSMQDQQGVRPQQQIGGAGNPLLQRSSFVANLQNCFRPQVRDMFVILLENKLEN